MSELFNGLVLRECRLKNVDANDIHQTLPKPKLPIGIIPGNKDLIYLEFILKY